MSMVSSEYEANVLSMYCGNVGMRCVCWCMHMCGRGSVVSTFIGHLVFMYVYT